VSVCLSVGWSVAIVSPAKTAEPIDMPFGMWTRVDQRNHVLDEGPDQHMRWVNFDAKKIICTGKSKINNSSTTVSEL